MRRARRATVEAVLGATGAQEHLDKLVNAGCDRREILSALAFLRSRWTDDSWMHLSGVNLKTLKRLVIKLRNCAAEVENLNKRPLMWAVANYGPPVSRRLYEIPHLL